MAIRRVGLSDLSVELASRFSAGDGLLWIGAGVSQRTSESPATGLPGVGGLVQHLSSRIKGQPPNPPTLEALSAAYVAQYGRDRLDRVIRAVYTARQIAAPRFFELVGQLPSAVRMFVTTNYDPFLERALVGRSPVIVVRDDRINEVTQSRPVVYKVHGDAAKPEGCVISTSDYIEWPTTSGQLPQVISQLFLQHDAVAIGYRAQDAHFLRLLNDINSRLTATGRQPRTLYIVGPNPNENDFAIHASPAFDLVLVDASGEAFIEWLLHSMEDVRRSGEAQAIAGLIDPPGLRSARDAVAEARSRLTHVEGEPEVRNARDAYVQGKLRVISLLIDAKRFREAAREHGWLARDFREWGKQDDWSAHALKALRIALEQCADPVFARELHQTMRVPASASGQFVSPTVEEYLRVLARVEILCGVPDGEPVILDALLRKIENESDSNKSARLREEHAELAASHAVSIADYTTAARNYAAVVTEPRSYECQVRAAVAMALAGDPTGALSVLQGLAGPAETATLRLRAIGWVACLAGEYDVSRDAFLRAGTLAAAQSDVLNAVIGFRGAGWATQFTVAHWFSADHPMGIAYRIEQSDRTTAASRATKTLLDDAHEYLANGKIRDAWLHGSCALRLAHEHFDPHSVSSARLVLARIWLRVLEKDQDEWSWRQGLSHLMVARAELNESEAKAAKSTLTAAMEDQVAGPQRQAALVNAFNALVSETDWTSGLMLLADVGESLSDATVHALVPAVTKGLSFNWSGVKQLDARNQALKAISILGRRLSVEDAGIVLERLASLVSTAPAIAHRDLFAAMWVVLKQGPVLVDGGLDLARAVLSAIPNGLGGYNNQALYSVMGLLATVANSQVAALVRGKLRELADIHDWTAADRLVQSGGDLPVELLERYLEKLALDVRALTRVTSSQAIGGGLALQASLLGRAHVAQESVYREAVNAIASLLNSDSIRAIVRFPWVEPLLYLSLDSQWALSVTAPVLLRLASGEFIEPDGEPFPSHTLSSVRINLGSAKDLRIMALNALGYILPRLDPHSRGLGGAAILSAFADTDPAIRRAAVRATLQYWASRESNADAPEGGRAHADDDESFYKAAMSAALGRDSEIRTTARKALRRRERWMLSSNRRT